MLKGAKYGVEDAELIDTLQLTFWASLGSLITAVWVSSWSSSSSSDSGSLLDGLWKKSAWMQADHHASSFTDWWRLWPRLAIMETITFGNDATIVLVVDSKIAFVSGNKIACKNCSLKATCLNMRMSESSSGAWKWASESIGVGPLMLRA